MIYARECTVRVMSSNSSCQFRRAATMRIPTSNFVARRDRTRESDRCKRGSNWPTGSNRLIANCRSDVAGHVAITSRICLTPTIRPRRTTSIRINPRLWINRGKTNRNVLCRFSICTFVSEIEAIEDWLLDFRGARANSWTRCPISIACTSKTKRRIEKR